MSGGGSGDEAYLMLKRPSLGGCVSRAWATQLEKAKISFVKIPIRSTGIGAPVAHRDKYAFRRATRMSLGKRHYVLTLFSSLVPSIVP